MANLPSPNRGEVWLVCFDPSVGAEIHKIRPAVVLSPDDMGRLPLKIVVPITQWASAYARFPWLVFLPASPRNGLTKDSAADAFQVKSVSESRIVRKLGSVSVDQLDEIASAIALCVGVP